MSNPLLELISRGESEVDGYNAYNRGMYNDANGKQHFRGPDKTIDLSSLTLGQVQDLQKLDRQDPNRLYAVGKYQIVPSTMDGAVSKLKLVRNERFTPELQDKIFSNYLIVDKQHAVHDFITGKPGASMEAAQRGLAREWASFGDPDKDGETHYMPPNHASITLKQSADALNQMRADYEASIDRGLTPDVAWQAAIDSGSSQTRANPQRSIAALHQGALGFDNSINHAPAQRDPRPRALPETGAQVRNPFADPCHPDHGLYAELKERIPEASENRLAQMTAACHMVGIKPGRLGDIHIGKQGIMLASDGPWPHAMVDNTIPAPSLQQTVQQVQAFDFQLAQQAQLDTQMAQQQSGPVIGSPRR